MFKKVLATALVAITAVAGVFATSWRIETPYPGTYDQAALVSGRESVELDESFWNESVGYAYAERFNAGVYFIGDGDVEIIVFTKDADLEDDGTKDIITYYACDVDALLFLDGVPAAEVFEKASIFGVDSDVTVYATSLSSGSQKRAIEKTGFNVVSIDEGSVVEVVSGRIRIEKSEKGPFVTCPYCHRSFAYSPEELSRPWM